MPSHNYIAQLEKISSILIYDPKSFDWANAAELNWQNKDPMDRLMVRIAVDKNYKILTKDRVILEKSNLASW